MSFRHCYKAESADFVIILKAGEGNKETAYFLPVC
jgi:hypothetical protein